MLGSVRRTEGAVEEFLFDARQSVSIFLFDTAAAFPSLSHEWRWESLYSLRMPTWLIATVQALYAESVATIVWNVVQSGVRLPILAGIKQGCPASGTLWALAYDPIVRALCWAVPHDLGCFGVFADDIRVALRHFFEGMFALTPVVQDMAADASLARTGARAGCSTTARPRTTTSLRSCG